MKFYITEHNIGNDVTKAQAEKVILLLRDRGWDVEYGKGNNQATDVSEFGREQQLMEAFADDFMRCASLIVG